MMSTSEKNVQIWNVYKIVFRLLSPLHIGCKKMENIQYTRRYVPAKTFWGALTAAIAKMQNDRNYQDIGDFLKANLRFSYFYLSENNDGSEQMIPSYYKKELKFGRYSKPEFENRFVDSYASTAISPTIKSAEEESLHEIEILTHYKKDSGDPVFLVGYILEKQNAGNLYPWQDALTLIQIGGERKYGFGRVELIPQKSFDSNKKLFGKFDIKLNGKNPTVEVSQNDPIPGHFYFSQNNSNSNSGGKEINTLSRIIGETEVLVTRETNPSKANKFGSRISKPILTFCPGCTDPAKAEKFQITKFGIWKKVE